MNVIINKLHQMLIDFRNYFTFIVSGSFEIKSSMKMIPSHAKHVATLSYEISGTF